MLPAGTQGLLQKVGHIVHCLYIYIQIYILERRALLYKIRIFLENYPKFANI